MTDSARDPLEEADTVEQIAPIEGAEPTEDPQRSSDDGPVEESFIGSTPHETVALGAAASVATAVTKSGCIVSRCFGTRA